MSMFWLNSAGGPMKWWAVQLRFDRPLSTRQLRLLTDLNGNGGHVDRDGADWDQWDHDWAEPDDDSETELLELLKRIDVPCRRRAAPTGWQCPCYQACSFEKDKCEPGRGCDPDWSDVPWIPFDPRSL